MFGVAKSVFDILECMPRGMSITAKSAFKMFHAFFVTSPMSTRLLHNLDIKSATRVPCHQSGQLDRTSGASSGFGHTFSLSLLIHCTMLSPWSARSSTSNVCAQSLRLGSPSSLTTYSAGSWIEPTPLDLWSRDFSTTASRSIFCKHEN
jgi:hypothetical protein